MYTRTHRTNVNGIDKLISSSSLWKVGLIVKVEIEFRSIGPSETVFDFIIFISEIITSQIYGLPNTVNMISN